MGVRPEKMTVLDAPDGHKAPASHNKILGRVTDVSYAGVSTQYLVRTPWEQELTVFEQNVIVGDRCSVGDEVLLHWAPEHTFGLDGKQDVHAGVAPEVLDPRRRPWHLSPAASSGVANTGCGVGEAGRGRPASISNRLHSAISGPDLAGDFLRYSVCHIVHDEPPATGARQVGQVSGRL